MEEVRLINGLKVVTNNTTKITFVTLSDGKLQELKDYIEEDPNVVVDICPTLYDSDFGEKLVFDVENLDILENLSNIKNIFLTISYDLKSYDGLKYLVNLECLLARFAEKVDFDFSFYPKLKEVKFNWTTKTKFFFKCLLLENITIWKYKSNDGTLSEFSSLVNLKKLTISQSNISCLSGISDLHYLSYLSINYNSKLEFIDSLPHDKFLYVEFLEIESCKKINIDFIAFFPNLKKLTLVKFQDIESLKLIFEGLSKLEELSISETKILDINDINFQKYSKVKINIW